MQINRTRRKHGRKPFLRYSTTRLTEWKLGASHGGWSRDERAEKGSHICRGHFATYADSMLGRKLDKPVTVWRPSHIRGAAKQGVVVSDYVVKAGATVEAKP